MTNTESIITVSHTAQLCVFDNLLARAWIQYATSARGLVAEIAAKIAARAKSNKLKNYIRSQMFPSNKS